MLLWALCQATALVLDETSGEQRVFGLGSNLFSGKWSQMESWQLPPPKKSCILGSDGSGNVHLAELELHWQQRCLQGCPGCGWAQLWLPVKDQRDAQGDCRYYM